ncbi:MAG: cysteine hydrolase [Deltaproteobacteria bacterium]|nr:cysteine hydrolase [Deltaproteobacteria bacterium]
MTWQSPKRALIVIDVQNEYVTGNLPIEYPTLDLSLPNIKRAIDAATQASIPVVVVQHVAPETSPIFAIGSHGWELHPIAQVENALHVQKKQPSAFADTGLAEWLRENGVDTLTVVGYMSQNCNESTIRHAADSGWSVEYLRDATGAVSYRNKMGFLDAKTMHEASCVVLQSRFAAVMTTEDWLTLIKSGQVAAREGLYQSYLNAH